MTSGSIFLSHAIRSFQRQSVLGLGLLSLKTILVCWFRLSPKRALWFKTVQFLVTQQPWLDLYGVNVRLIAPLGGPIWRGENVEKNLAILDSDNLHERNHRKQTVFSGHYTLLDDKVEAAMLYSSMRLTILLSANPHKAEVNFH
ncbi:hypothetical protein MLD38_022458 [Melastoma candidum]|uniref:Uncharacterized protein n=1 Tax=Melastoma candidum TaxID=119954 RepID=A0ACB9QL45_9MYRT|nr:hypothetical protein MLD38_022458 [Melastoma candidum]